MAEVNNSDFVITVVSPSDFSIGIDTTGYDAYGSEGIACYLNCKRTHKDCVTHSNIINYGGFIGMIQGGVTIA